MIQNSILDSVLEISKNKLIYLFGAGSFGKQIKEEFDRLGLHVKGFIDNDSSKFGKVIDGRPVYSLNEIENNSFIIICSSFFSEIEKQLLMYGLSKDKDFMIIQPYAIEDKFIKWLTYANAGMLHPGNVEVFDYVIKNLPSEKPIIEIGSFCGLSTNVISYLLQKYKKNNIVFSSDKWVFEGSSNSTIGFSDVTFEEYRMYVKNSFTNNIEFFSRNRKPYTIEEFSDDFFELWSKKQKVTDVFKREVTLGGKISFCYVDGNHTYPFAKRDFENADTYLEVGGFIFFDDSCDKDTFGLTQLMNEILRNDRYELVTKNPNYLFKKVK